MYNKNKTYLQNAREELSYQTLMPDFSSDAMDGISVAWMVGTTLLKRTIHYRYYKYSFNI